MRDSLVIVVFKGLDQIQTKIPQLLTRRIEKKLYIEWTDDSDEQRLFWRRLVYTIRCRRYDHLNHDICIYEEGPGLVVKKFAKGSWGQRHDPGKDTPLLSQNYIYDVFVAYSSHGEERSWVHTELRKKLENEHGLKLCMSYRDIKVGRDLADTIVEAIESSNKNLFILGPDFLKSVWSEFELYMARQRQIFEGRDSLVVVFFKGLDKMVKFKRMKRRMKKKFYIEWTDDPDKQILFWRKLVDAIRCTS